MIEASCQSFRLPPYQGGGSDVVWPLSGAVPADLEADGDCGRLRASQPALIRRSSRMVEWVPPSPNAFEPVCTVYSM